MTRKSSLGGEGGSQGIFSYPCFSISPGLSKESSFPHELSMWGFLWIRTLSGKQQQALDKLKWVDNRNTFVLGCRMFLISRMLSILRKHLQPPPSWSAPRGRGETSSVPHLGRSALPTLCTGRGSHRFSRAEGQFLTFSGFSRGEGDQCTSKGSFPPKKRNLLSSGETLSDSEGHLWVPLNSSPRFNNIMFTGVAPLIDWAPLEGGPCLCISAPTTWHVVAAPLNVIVGFLKKGLKNKLLGRVGVANKLGSRMCSLE